MRTTDEQVVEGLGTIADHDDAVEDVGLLESAEGELLVDGARLSATGIDRVEILIASNAGEELRALRRIASGGELSRALLAIKRALAGERRATSAANPGFPRR